MAGTKKLRFKQIAIGQYRTRDGGLSFVPIALSTDGQVYKFLLEDGWISLEDAAERSLNALDEVEAGLGDIFG